MRSKKRICDLLFLISAVSIVCFLIWKCRFGFGNIDESFYLTIPWRLSQGDSLFYDEWHLSQMSGFLLLPFVYAYRAFHEGTEGIILTFRYICVAVQTVCCLYYYIRLRRLSAPGALAATLPVLIYIPFNITALSYNSMGIFLLGISLVTLATADCHTGDKSSGRPSSFKAVSGEAIGSHRAAWIISGLSFAGAVLCCPYLIVVYAIYTCILFVFLITKTLYPMKVKPRSESSLSAWSNVAASFSRVRKTDLESNPARHAGRQLPSGNIFFTAALYIKMWVWFTLGAASLALVFAVFVLRRASISDIASSFPLIMSDPEHIPVSFLTNLAKYGYHVFHATEWSPAIMVFLGILFAITICDKGRKKRRVLYLVLAIAGTMVLLASMKLHARYINHLMFPLNLLSVFCFLLTEDKRCRRLFHTVVVPGMLYTVCIHFTSNQQFYVISSASTVALTGSIMMLALLAEEIIINNGNNFYTMPLRKGEVSLSIKMTRGFAALVPAILSVLLVLTLDVFLLNMRYEKLFWETGLAEQTRFIDHGPDAGLKVTSTKERMYYELLEDTESITAAVKKDLPIRSILFLSDQTWLYLACPSLEMASCSAWLSGINDNTLERLMAYYELNPAKLPEAIYAGHIAEGLGDKLAYKLGFTQKIPLRGGFLFLE